MADTNDGTIIPVPIEDEMKGAYLTYAMSVIVSRALPDVRDGLKPVHRRILYAMNDMGITPDKEYKKSARIVGEVLGKYHPHGDQAVYNTLVRLAQDFSMRYLIIDGQGNYGSVDGDSPAAMRYTEARMTRFAMELLEDIKKNTVDTQLNFDDSLEEPVVLPAGVPNLLVNGTTGIAVGMATNIPPHNLTEVVNGVCAVIDNPDLPLEELLNYVSGPDFPTQGIIYGRSGIKSAYLTGRGKITVRARVEMEEMRGGREALIIHELPYQVNKAELLIKIAGLVKDKKIEGIGDIRDESDRKGMRVVIELKKGANSMVVLNRLYAHTQMQNVFGIIMLALVNKQPKVLNLKEVMVHYIAHRKEIIIRRTQFDLDKAEKRAHIVEGLLKALGEIDAVIKLIRASKSTEEARTGLMSQFGLSEAQAQAILEMRLQRLTALETKKLQDEYNELIKFISKCQELLGDDKIQYKVMKDELLLIKEKYGDKRKTVIMEDLGAIDTEDLIAEEDNVVTITHGGYIKRLPTNTYKKQKRGGVGVSGTSSRQEDFVEHLFVTSTHNYIMFFSNHGRTFFVKVHEIPEASRTARGRHIKLLLQLGDEEVIKAFVPVKDFNITQPIVLITKNGIIKRSNLSDFSNARTRGIRAMNLDDNDLLISAVLSDGQSDLLLCTRQGKALRIKENEVREMGRAARGVIGIRMKGDNEIIGVEKVSTDHKLLVISKRGYGKLMKFDEMQAHGRGTGGQIYLKINNKTGDVAAVHTVKEDDEVVVVTSQGMIIKTGVKGISTFGRMASGVKIVNVKEDDFVVAVASTDAEEESGDLSEENIEQEEK
ncbi:MAG: DNA gyrase subunit A [Spirochaetota bacterium]|nr:DNA gyrase subunit A [Spirochaetota bacterium]